MKNAQIKNINKEINNNKKLEKLFTKNKIIIIMKKNYNPLKVNCKSIYEREGLVMKKTNDIILEEIRKELNWKQKIVTKLFNKTFSKVCNLARKNTVNSMLK